MAMDWILLITLLVTGLVLIVVEILFVPGTTIVGLFGFAFAVTAIFAAYHYFGKTIGSYFLAGSVVTFSIAIYFSFKSDVWLKFANKGTLTSKVNEGVLESMVEGLEGKTLSALRPVGKAEFGNKVFEVTSSGHIEEGKAVKITKVKDNRIFVEPLNS